MIYEAAGTSVKTAVNDVDHAVAHGDLDFHPGVALKCVSAWNKDPVFGVIGIQSGLSRIFDEHVCFYGAPISLA